MPRLLVVLVVVSLAGALPGASFAQAAEEPASAFEQLDRELLYRVYRTRSPWFVVPIRGAHHSSYPVIFGTAPAMWTAALTTGTGSAAAYRLSLSQLGAGLVFSGFKRVVRRPRPHHALPDVTSRTGSRVEDTLDPFSFPSGHATLAAATATSLSLSYPRWYVVGPGALWTVGVALSRVWYGVHYPSDVAAGALLGSTVALGVHLLGPILTPARWSGGDATLFSVQLVW